MSYNQRRTIGTGVPAVGKQFLSKLIKDFIFYNHSGLVSSLPTTSRTTDLIVPDHEGILRTFGNGEVGIEGGRVVENLAANSVDLTDAGFNTGGSTTLTYVSVSEGTRIEYPTGAGTYVEQGALPQGTLTISAEFKLGDSGSSSNVWFGLADGTSTPTEANRAELIPSTDFVRISKTVDCSGFADPTLIIECDVTETFDVYCRNLQIENVTAQSNQNPSEYQPVGTPTGADLVDAADSASDWTAYGTNTIEDDDGAVKITYVDNINGAYVSLTDAEALTRDLLPDESIIITADIKVSSGANVQLEARLPEAKVTNIENTSFQTFTLHKTANITPSLNWLQFDAMSAGEIVWIKNLKIFKATTGKQVYATANGNTVASNVVTEATGASLSPAPAVYCEPAHTNLITYSEEFDNAAWTKFQATTGANETAAPDSASTADAIDSAVLTDTEHRVSQTISVSLGADTAYVTYAYFKKSAVDYAVLSLFDDASIGVRYHFDLANGVVGADTSFNSPVNPFSGIESLGNGWHKCWVGYTVNSARTSLTVRILPSPTDGTLNYSAADTTSAQIYIWGAQVTESSAPLSYVPTSGATATANATEPVVTWPDLVNDFAIKVKWTPDNVSGTIALIGSYTDASNSLLLSWASNTITLTKRVSATDYSATVALTPSADTEYALSVRLSSINGVDVWAASTKGTGDSNTTDAVMASNLSIGDDGNSANHGVGTIRDLKIYKVSPSISDAQVLSL